MSDLGQPWRVMWKWGGKLEELWSARGKSTLNLRDRAVNLKGKWNLPSLYDPKKDQVLELVTAKKPHADDQNAIKEAFSELEEFSIEFVGLSLIIVALPPCLGERMLSQFSGQLSNYMKRSGKRFGFMSYPFWRGSNGKVYAPKYGLYNPADAREDEIPHGCKGLVALEIGCSRCEAWAEMVDNDAFESVVGLVLEPQFQVHTYSKQTGWSVEEDAKFVNLNHVFEGLRLYTDVLPLGWESQDRLTNYESVVELAGCLAAAINAKDDEKCKKIINFMPDLNVVSPKMTCPPLSYAVAGNMEELVKYMVLQGAHPYYVDIIGSTPHSMSRGSIREFFESNCPQVAEDDGLPVIARGDGWSIREELPGRYLVCGISSDQYAKIVHGIGSELGSHHSYSQAAKRMLLDYDDVKDAPIRKIETLLSG